jgi:photosystem II stability/assembly factor-like uncharacterized protein
VPHNRNNARRIQNMGWRADGGLWLLTRGGGLFFSEGTGVSALESSRGLAEAGKKVVAGIGGLSGETTALLQRS